MAFIAERISVFRGRPPGLAAGISGASRSPFRTGQIAGKARLVPPIPRPMLVRPHRLHLADIDRQGESSRSEPGQALLGQALSGRTAGTRHVRDAFKAMPVKTDRKDARGIAQLMRLGWFLPVHCKSLPAQEVRALLTTRKLLQGKRHDVEMSIRGVLRGFGLKVGPTTPKTLSTASASWSKTRNPVLSSPTRFSRPVQLWVWNSEPLRSDC
jgi:hypothetical protein